MLIKRNTSIIPACDVTDLDSLISIVEATKDESAIAAYKIGFSLGLSLSLKLVADTIKQATGKLVIYDHQKAGTDIPDTGKVFAKVMKEAGVDSVILFPQAGPVTEEAWIKHCQDAGLHVIVGGKMTHQGYIESDGGFIREKAPCEMLEIAAKAGVKDFVVPGNQPEFIKKIRELYNDYYFSLYAPGFVTQGGSISESGKAAGNNWHAIVGSAIYKAEDKAKAVKELVSQL